MKSQNVWSNFLKTHLTLISSQPIYFSSLKHREIVKSDFASVVGCLRLDCFFSFFLLKFSAFPMCLLLSVIYASLASALDTQIRIGGKWRVHYYTSQICVNLESPRKLQNFKFLESLMGPKRNYARSTLCLEPPFIAHTLYLFKQTLFYLEIESPSQHRCRRRFCTEQYIDRDRVGIMAR